MIPTHPDAPVIVRRLGPGVYRAECAQPVLPDDQPCGWIGQLHEGPWQEARAKAEADADAHAGRAPRPAPKGPTPTRPVRIADELWDAVGAVSLAEGVSASDVLRSALAAYPPVAAAAAELAKAGASS